MTRVPQHPLLVLHPKGYRAILPKVQAEVMGIPTLHKGHGRHPGVLHRQHESLVTRWIISIKFRLRDKQLLGIIPNLSINLISLFGHTVSYTQPSSYLGRSPMPVPSTQLYPPLGPNPGNLPDPWPDISQVPLAPQVPPLLPNPPAYQQVLPPTYQDYRLENQNPNITGNWGNAPHPAPPTMLGNPPVPQVLMGVPYPPNLGNPHQQWPQQPRYPFPHNPQMKDAKLSKYDGKIPFRAYEVKVDLMAVQHRWDEATKITKLVEALEGAALKIL